MAQDVQDWDLLAPESAVERATGLALGVVPLSRQPVSGPRHGAALAALESAVLPALLRPPCFVTFSGGIDSALVLAIATRVARRHGLADPVPFSWRFDGLPAVDETARQDRILLGLGLTDRVVSRAQPGELDFVGPEARRTLVRHGFRHPANLHFHARPVELARGGSVLTGVGGDQVLSGWRRPETRTLARRWKDRVPAALRVAARRLPARELPWLHPAVAAGVLKQRMAEEAAEPLGMADRVRWHAGRREFALSLTNLRLLGDAEDVLVVNPLAETGFVHALAHEFGDRPAPRRSALIASLVHGTVPEVVWQPRRKARFGDVFMSVHARALAQGWDGGGVDPCIVDAAALRRAWGSWPVPLATAGLLQQVFLASRPGWPNESAAHEETQRWTTRPLG